MTTCTCAGAHSPRAPRRGAFTAALAVGLVGCTVLGAGAAYAYWTATGSGTATAQSTTAVALEVSAAGQPAASLHPGRTEDLAFVVGNANSYPVRLTTLIAATVSTSDPVACPASSIVVPAEVTAGMAAGGYALPTPVDVPAGAAAAPASLAGFLTMATTAPDGCQGRTFSVTLSFSGTQV